MVVAGGGPVAGGWGELIRYRHPKDFSLGSLSTKLEISKNRFFIRQVKRRIWSRVELVLPFSLTKLIRASEDGGEENALLLLLTGVI
nr:hypothetical protein [Tanacetum cinerariifolium]